MSEVRVNKLSPRSGTTVTLGDSGDTISIPSGVTLSNAGTNTFASATITGDLTVDTNTLKVDSANNRVGIGTTSPTRKLEVSEAGTAYFRVADTTNSVNVDVISASSGGFIGTASSDPFIFQTANTERMRIDSSGNLLVGKTGTSNLNNGFALVPNGASNIVRDGGLCMQFNRKTSDGNILQFLKDGTTVGSVSTAGGDLLLGTNDLGIRFYDSIDAVVPINQSTTGNEDNTKDLGNSGVRWKDLYLGGGLYVGGTGTANKLDDYEEGTWTPNIGGNATYSAQAGHYRKIGNMVFANFQIQINVKGTGNGSQLEGLPFTSSANTAVNVQSGYTSYFANLNTAVNSLAFYVERNTTTAEFVSTTSTTTTVNNGANVFADNTHIYGAVVYAVD